MGYRARKVYRLTWGADTDFEGLEVTMRGVPLGRLLDIQSATEEDADDGKPTGERVRRMAAMLAESLMSWNVEEEDGTPVPADLDGLLSRDAAEVMAIIGAWSESISSVPTPLPNGSPAGSTFPEASIPMEILSPSLVS